LGCCIVNLSAQHIDIVGQDRKRTVILLQCGEHQPEPQKNALYSISIPDIPDTDTFASIKKYSVTNLLFPAEAADAAAAAACSARPMSSAVGVSPSGGSRPESSESRSELSTSCHRQT